MTIQLIDPKLIDPNPFQPPTRLNFTPDSLSDLESIKDIGFINTPRGRVHPAQPGRFQLVEGHRRRAAWIIYRPGLPMPLEVNGYDDRALFEVMAIENAARLDLSAIEEAQLLKRYIEQFQATQAQAGKLLNLKTQAAVSNKLSLLELPAEIQALIAAGQLPERLARAFRPLRSLRADEQLIKIARQVAAFDESKDKDPLSRSTKESQLQSALGEVLRQRAHYMSTAPWPEKWQPGMSADIGEGPIEIPACHDCPFNRQINHGNYCLRPACWSAKHTAWAVTETAKAAKAKGIPAAAPGEKIKIVEDRDVAQKLLASKSEAVRLVPVSMQGAQDYYARDSRKRLTGSEFTGVAVLASQASQLLKTVAKTKQPAARSKPARDYGEAEYKKKQQIYQANRQRVAAAIQLCASALIPLMPSQPRTLHLIVERLNGELGRRNIDPVKATPTELRAWLAEVLLDDCDQLSYATSHMDDDLAETREALLAFAHAHKLTYPAGWDASLLPPPLPSKRDESKSKSKPKSKPKKASRK